MKFTKMLLEELNPELFEKIKELEILINKQDDADELTLVRECLFSILKGLPEAM